MYFSTFFNAQYHLQVTLPFNSTGLQTRKNMLRFLITRQQKETVTSISLNSTNNEQDSNLAVSDQELSDLLISLKIRITLQKWENVDEVFFYSC